MDSSTLNIIKYAIDWKDFLSYNHVPEDFILKNLWILEENIFFTQKLSNKFLIKLHYKTMNRPPFFFSVSVVATSWKIPK